MLRNPWGLYVLTQRLIMTLVLCHIDFASALNASTQHFLPSLKQHIKSMPKYSPFLYEKHFFFPVPWPFMLADPLWCHFTAISKLYFIGCGTSFKKMSSAVSLSIRLELNQHDLLQSPTETDTLEMLEENLNKERWI